MMNHHKIAATTLLALAPLLGGGCATPAAKRVEVAWPPPPDVARVRYVDAISNSLDVAGARSSWDELVSIFAGEDPGVALRKPFAVHADISGRVFVGDSGWPGVLMFDPAKHEFAVWGENGDGEIRKATGFASSTSGDLYVADGAGGRVVRFNRAGIFVRAYGGAGKLIKPTGVAINEKLEKLYVVDTGAHHLSVFNSETGAHLGDIGERGEGADQLNYPTHIAIDSDGKLYVVDTFNFRIKILDSDGQVVRMFGQTCDQIGCLVRPKGIGVDSDGHIYVADAAFNAVQVFDEQGQLLLVFGGLGHGPGHLWLPAGLYVAPDDRIYVADSYNYRLNTYRYIGEPRAEANEGAKAVGEVIETAAPHPDADVTR